MSLSKASIDLDKQIEPFQKECLFTSKRNDRADDQPGSIKPELC
ncbi:5562_t:CDS:2 [Funneliformis geosporum]|nr:5562_t:CDS:2 [Funneliformis geosporum]